jgi:hypothetical protein
VAEPTPEALELLVLRGENAELRKQLEASEAKSSRAATKIVEMQAAELQRQVDEQMGTP